jgi:hypothetical protein
VAGCRPAEAVEADQPEMTLAERDVEHRVRPPADKQNH